MRVIKLARPFPCQGNDDDGDDDEDYADEDDDLFQRDTTKTGGVEVEPQIDVAHDCQHGHKVYQHLGFKMIMTKPMMMMRGI